MQKNNIIQAFVNALTSVLLILLSFSCHANNSYGLQASATINQAQFIGLHDNKLFQNSTPAGYALNIQKDFLNFDLIARWQTMKNSSVPRNLFDFGMTSESLILAAAPKFFVKYNEKRSICARVAYSFPVGFYRTRVSTRIADFTEKPDHEESHTSTGFLIGSQAKCHVKLKNQWHFHLDALYSRQNFQQEYLDLQAKLQYINVSFGVGYDF